MKRQKTIATFFILLFSMLLCKANNPAVISNVKAMIDKKNNKVIIFYDLSDTEDNQIEVKLKITDDKGETLIINEKICQGDFGFPVTTGHNKSIVWIYEKNNFDPKKCKINLIADDRYKINPDQIIKEVDTLRMIRDLNFINGERNSSSEEAQKHLREVGEYLKNAFRDNRIKSYYQDVKISNSELNKIWKEKTGLGSIIENGNKKYNIKNVIGSIDGYSNQKETIILSAHYDSYPGSLGMDDNGSGVIGLLEAMRVLSKFNFAYNVKFIGFDKEEDGLLGSLSYVSKLAKESEKIRGVINFDMIGICSNQPNSQFIPEGFDQLYPEVCASIKENKNRGDFIINASNESSKQLSDLFVNTANKYVPDLKVVSLTADSNGEYISSMIESDHAAFWYTNNPALHIGEGGETRNPNLHTFKDSKEYLKFNYKFMSDIVKTTIAMFIELGEAEHYTIAEVHLTK